LVELSGAEWCVWTKKSEVELSQTHPKLVYKTNSRIHALGTLKNLMRLF